MFKHFFSILAQCSPYVLCFKVMKKATKIFGICVVAVMLSQPLTTLAKGHGLFGTPSKYKNVFVCRAERKLEGAKVEVLYANGELLTAQTMHKRKLIIDFGDVRDGVYTIRVSKGNRVQEFHYNKKTIAEL